MPRQIALHASVLHSWSLRGLLLALADREPPVLVPCWSATTLTELGRRIQDDVSPRLGPAEARAGAERIVAGIVACFPEAAVPDVAGAAELDLLDRRDAGVVAAALAAGAETVATTDPARLPPADIAHLGLTALHPDDLLLELHADDPWRVLHATMLYAFVLRRPGRTTDDLLAVLAREVPRFVAVVRAQVAGLPMNQPAAVFAATHGQVSPGDDAEEGWCCVACDPFPCPGDDALEFRLWGTTATCLPADECCFVGVTQTARHWTLVWPASDDRRLLEIAAEMRNEHRHPRPVPYSPTLGPAMSYWEWEATGNLVHGFHDPTPPARGS